MHPQLAERLRVTGAAPSTLHGLLLDGATALDTATGEQPEGPAKLRNALVRGEAEHLVFETRLLQVWREVRDLAAEVWDLERNVTGERPADPPAIVPADLPEAWTLTLPVDAEIRDAAAAATDAAATGDPLVVLLSYAVAVTEVGALDDAAVAQRVVEAGGRAATAKFELTQALDMRTHLTLRRGGLRGIQEASALRQRDDRPPSDHT